MILTDIWSEPYNVIDDVITSYFFHLLNVNCLRFQVTELDVRGYYLLSLFLCMKDEFLPPRYHSKLCKRWYCYSREVLSVCLSIPHILNIVSKGTKISSLAESPKTIGVDLSPRLMGHNGEFSLSSISSSPFSLSPVLFLRCPPPLRSSPLKSS